MNPLLAWVGAGGVPVPLELATKRAEFCVHCPLNGHGKWWERVKNPIAQSIIEILSFKAHRKLFVEQEEKLFMCSACGCALRLKVHAPIKHIRDNISETEMEKLDRECWIRKEIV